MNFDKIRAKGGWRGNPADNENFLAGICKAEREESGFSLFYQAFEVGKTFAHQDRLQSQEEIKSIINRILS